MSTERLTHFDGWRPSVLMNWLGSVRGEQVVPSQKECSQQCDVGDAPPANCPCHHGRPKDTSTTLAASARSTLPPLSLAARTGGLPTSSQ